MRKALLIGIAALTCGAHRSALEEPLLRAQLTVKSISAALPHSSHWRLPIRCVFLNTGTDTLWLEDAGPEMRLLDYVVRGNEYEETQQFGCGSASAMRLQPVAPRAAYEFDESVAWDPQLHVLQVILNKGPKFHSRHSGTGEYWAWSDPFPWPGPDRRLNLHISRRGAHGESQRR